MLVPLDKEGCLGGGLPPGEQGGLGEAVAQASEALWVSLYVHLIPDT